MSRRVAKRRYDANALDGVFAVLDENQAVLVGQQVLARGIDEKFHHAGRRGLGLISPEIMLDLGHDDLRIGEKAFALVAHDAGKMVDMAMGEDDRVDIVGLDTGRRQGVL